MHLGMQLILREWMTEWPLALITWISAVGPESDQPETLQVFLRVLTLTPEGLNFVIIMITTQKNNFIGLINNISTDSISVIRSELIGSELIRLDWSWLDCGQLSSNVLGLTPCPKQESPVVALPWFFICNFFELSSNSVGMPSEFLFNLSFRFFQLS